MRIAYYYRQYLLDIADGVARHEQVCDLLGELRAAWLPAGVLDGKVWSEGNTRLLEFGRLSTERREASGDRRPETFTFLGSTH